MPYIKKERRPAVNTRWSGQDNTGDLNYKLTQVIIKYLQRHGLSYATINDIKGALAGCYDEFHDRVARPYEDRKIQENGDVYPPEFTGS